MKCLFPIRRPTRHSTTIRLKTPTAILGGGGHRDSSEAPLTLTETAPRSLGLLDQFGLWGNLGVSLTGFAYAYLILHPSADLQLSASAAITAIIVGSALGGLIFGTVLVLGARTGAPAMVLLRGVLGARASYLPTVLNIAQCVGWAVIELSVIAQGLQALSRGHLAHWWCVVIAGAVTTALTIKPLGAIRALRKYVSILVVLALIVFVIGLLRQPATPTSGSWAGFWLAADVPIAFTISFVPLGPDYSRHSRSGRAAFAGGFFGYGATQIICLLMGVMALNRLSELQQDTNGVFNLFLSLPLGLIAFGVLVLRETDQSFANVYSTAISLQNIAPRWDRRLLTTAIGVLATAAALTVDTSTYQNFLYLIGAIFISLSGVLVALWLRTAGLGLDLSSQAPTRPGMLLGWLLGFVAYQLINPGSTAGWGNLWTNVGESLHTLGHPWLSASLTSFVIALLVALPFAGSQAAPSRQLAERRP